MRRSLTAVTAAIAGALAVSACSSGTGPASAGSGRTIVIGTTLSLTGSPGALGPPAAAGYRQEIADVNAAGGVTVAGHKDQLKLVILDNAGDPATASAQAGQLVRKDHAVALLGATSSPIVTTTALTAEQLHVPFITSMTPVEAFASGDKTGWKYAWDFFFNEDHQAAAAAKALAAAASNKKVVLFTDDEPDAVVERPLYQAAFQAAGLDVVGDDTFPVGTTDFSAFIAAARAKGAQLLAGELVPADGAALWQQLKSRGFRPRAAFLANATDPDAPYQSLGPIAQDTLSDGFWSPGQATAAQLAKITPTLGRKYAGTPGYSAAAIAYAAAEVLTDAIARAGSTAPGRLTAAIGRSHAPTTAGLITFSPVTHTGVTPSYVTQWQSGHPVQVQPAVSGVTYQQPAEGLG